MCFVGSLMVYFTFQITTMNVYIENRTLCTVIGYLSYYFGLASFFWLNAMCVEIFLKIGLSSFQLGESSSLVKFIKMASYSFGIPLIFTIFMFLLDHTAVGNIMQKKYHPKIGQQNVLNIFYCFLQSEWIFWIISGHLLWKIPSITETYFSRIKYFYSILTILLSINAVLFIWVLINIYRVQSAVSCVSAKKDKERCVI